MVLSSAIFLFAFFPAAFVVYRLTPGIRAKNAVLAVISLFFYCFGKLTYLPLLVGSILLNWGAGRLLGRLEDKRARRAVGVAAVALDADSVRFTVNTPLGSGEVRFEKGGNEDGDL